MVRHQPWRFFEGVQGLICGTQPKSEKKTNKTHKKMQNAYRVTKTPG